MIRNGLAAAVFLGLLWFQAHRSRQTPPLIQIGAITPRMNFSAVRVEGVLEADARRLGNGAVFYAINDGTGILPVFLEDGSGAMLARRGSRVAATGYLGVGAGNDIRLRVRSVDRLAVEVGKVPSGDSVFATITRDLKGERIVVCGRVRNVWAPKPGSRAPHRIVLEDASGSMDVVHWLDEAPAVKVGDVLRISGSVDVYRNRVQIRVWDAGGIRHADETSG